MLIKSHHKHVVQRKEILGIHPKAYPQKTPAHPAIDNEDDSENLNEADSDMGKFRSAVGILLYFVAEHAVIEVFTDAHWASWKDDRRSISSCAILYGGCLLHASSRTQKIRSLSSAESEMYAAAPGACDSVLIVGILKWMFDAFFQICLYLDSAAARGIINRRGVGKVRHLSCGVCGSKNAWQMGQ